MIDNNFYDSNELLWNDIITRQDSNSSCSQIKINNQGSTSSIQKSGLENPVQHDYDQKKNVYQENTNYIEDLDKLLQNKEERYKKFIKFKTIINENLAASSYSLQKYLTCGGEGIIFEGIKQQEQGAQESIIVKINFDGEEKDIQEEIEIMKIFEQNINVIKFIDSIRVTDQIYIFILERCKESLFDELKNMVDKSLEFSLQKLLQMIFDLLDGLIQLRIYNILHLDIKPKNILVSQSGNYLYSDFGNSHNTSKNKIINVKGKTTYFASLEQKSASPNINFSSDIYSLGKTFQKIFETYKKINKFDPDIEKFEKIVEENMIKEEQSERKSCQQLHILFLGLSLTIKESFFISEYSNKINKNYPDIVEKQDSDQDKKDKLIMTFLVNYTDKIKLILQLFPYDANKDLTYFQDIRFYYQQTLLDIQKSIIGSTTDNNLEIANSLYNLGLYSIDLGNLKMSLKYLFKSLRMRESLGKEHNIDVATTLNMIGKCLKTFGFYKVALKFSQKSLVLRKQLFNEVHPSIAESLDNVGQCYFELRQLQEAQQALIESLDMRIMLDVENNQDISESLLNIGKCLNEMGEFTLALQYSMKSLEMKKQLFQGNHPSIAASLCYVGLCYKDINDYHEALKCSEQSLKMRKQLFKDNHPDIIESLLIVESCSGKLNTNKQSLSNLEGIEKMAEQVVLNTHQLIKVTQNNKGIAYFIEGDYHNGIKSILKSLHIDQYNQKRGSSLGIIYHFNIGYCFYVQGDYKISLEYFLQVLEIIEKQKNYFKQAQEYQMYSVQMIGICLIELSDSQNGLKCVNKSLKIQKSIFQDDHSARLIILKLVIIHLLKNNYFKEAFNYSKQFNAIVKKHFKGVSICIPYSKYITGLCNYYVGNYKKALNFYLKSLNDYEYIQKKYPSKYILALNAIVLCYRDLKDHQNALVFMQKSLNMNQIFLNENNEEMIKTFCNLGLCYCDVGDSQNGLIYTLKALEMDQKQKKKNNKLTATIFNCVGYSYFIKGDYQNALEYHLKSLELRRQIFIKNHPALALSLYDVGTTYQKKSDFQSALLYLLESLELRKKLYNGYHPDIELSLNSIKECFYCLG